MFDQFVLPNNKTHHEFFSSNRKKVFVTHNDLDGISCRIVASMYADMSDPYGVDILYPDRWNYVVRGPKDLDIGFQKWKPKNFDELDYDIMICDLSVSAETAERLDRMMDHYRTEHRGPRFWVLDHHASSAHLTRYNWAYVELVHNWSATKLLYGILRDHKLSSLATRYADGDDTLENYVEAVSKYDLGEFTGYGLIGVSLNRAFVELGYKKYAATMISHISDHSRFAIKDLVVSGMDYEMKCAIKLKEDKDEVRYQSLCENYFRALNHPFGETVQACSLAVVVGSPFGQGYNSWRFLTEHPDVDVLAYLNLTAGTISLRTNSDEFNLSAIASKFGGGGHKKAAAFKFNPNFINIKFDSNDLTLVPSLNYEDIWNT